MTGRQVTLWAATIVPFSELPFLLGLTTSTYAVGALILGLAQVAIAVDVRRPPNGSRTRGGCSTRRSPTCRCCGC